MKHSSIFTDRQMREKREKKRGKSSTNRVSFFIWRIEPRKIFHRNVDFQRRTLRQNVERCFGFGFSFDLRFRFNRWETQHFPRKMSRSLGKKRFSFFLGNGIVLAVGFYKRKYKKNVTNCFIMNLSLTDFLFLLISVPLTSYLGMSKKWIFGNFICKINIYLAYVSFLFWNFN